MSFCGRCGAEQKPNSVFCHACGAPLNSPATVNSNITANTPVMASMSNPIPVANKLHIPLYKGTEKVFPFMGRTLHISSGMDTYNYYRKTFRSLARQAADALKREYMSRVFHLDAFLRDFPVMYFHYRKPLISATVDIFPLVEIYDVSLQAFEERHTKDFCLCGNDMQIMKNSINMTINVNKGHPLTQDQSMQLFARINPNLLIEHAYTDYWNIYLSLAGRMHERGLDIYYPNEEDNQRANGLFQNLCASKLPEEKTPDFIMQLLQTNPYVDDYFRYIIQKYGKTDEVTAICSYFDFFL